MSANRFPKEPATDPEQPARSTANGIRRGVSSHLVNEVVVLEVSGQLRDVVEELTHAVRIALAEGPRGIVCDLSAVVEGAEPRAVEALAVVGSHVRDWPGIPLAVACPDLRVRQALSAQPLGGYLIVTSALLSAVSAVLARPALAVEWLHLAPHPTALCASRDFVTRTLLDWQLGRAIRFARLVMSELVMSSTMNADTDMDLSVAWDQGAVRLTVRDYSPDLPRQRDSAFGMQRRGLAIISGLSRTFGVLPTADGGTVVWAVIDAPGAACRPAHHDASLPRHYARHPSSPTPSAWTGSPAAAKPDYVEAYAVPRRASESTSRQPACHHEEGVAHVAH